MNKLKISGIKYIFVSLLAGFFIILSGCANNQPVLESEVADVAAPLYLIGPGDSLNIFVWGNAELSKSVPVRPDGKITTPLVEDIQASGKTSTQSAREMEKSLSKYVKNPIVTVYVTSFVGRYSEQVRVIGQAAKPQSLSYKERMTVLDVMIATGGLTEFAAGNRATLVRTAGGQQQQFRVRLDDLINGGDINANVNMSPGDILIIPEAWF